MSDENVIQAERIVRLETQMQTVQQAIIKLTELQECQQRYAKELDDRMDNHERWGEQQNEQRKGEMATARESRESLKKLLWWVIGGLTTVSAGVVVVLAKILLGG